MRAQLVGEREPLAALANSGELPMTLLFDMTPAAFEREQLLMPDARQSLPRTPARSDLHSAVVPDVVDHLDDGEGEFVVGDIAVPPTARRAYPDVTDPRSGLVGAEDAGSGKSAVGHHQADDTRVMGAAGGLGDAGTGSATRADCATASVPATASRVDRPRTVGRGIRSRASRRPV